MSENQDQVRRRSKPRKPQPEENPQGGPHAVPPPVIAGRRARTSGRQPISRRHSGLYLPWWSLVVLIFLVGLAAFGIVYSFSLMGGAYQRGGLTPTFIIITQTPTPGDPLATLAPTPTITPTIPLPTLVPTSTLPPGDFAIGAVVEIVGVGEAGLNLREGAGTSFVAVDLGYDGERFVLKDGPRMGTGEEWWQIEPVGGGDPVWAARRFLTVVAAQ